MLVMTREELKDVTGAAQRATQRRSLDALGIPYRVNCDGWPVVLRSEAIAALGGHEADAQPEPKEAILNLDAI